ncbi:OmpH family outer membrane protein [Saccharospirillum mangrovi]|uniref:OmpH family outer membrane protein n=1 Tax=Saccharospirillum mangrovi TaxID=2161747 RepID=UPI00130024DD|nr:OmpH family outer membrane protein [Saccharospirillum mangrovi]
MKFHPFKASHRSIRPLLLVVMSSLALLSATAQAEDLALLDQDYVLFNSQVAQQASNALKQEFAREEQQVQTLEQSIRQLQSQARTDADIMTDEERARLQSDLQSRLREREQLVRQLQQVQAERRNAFIRQYQPILAQAVENVAGEQFDIIFDKGAVIYHRNSLDITEAVLNEFNSLVAQQGGAN